MVLKWRIVLLAIIVLACVANHVERHFRAQRIAREAQEWDVPAMQLDVNSAGHSSLRVEEAGPHKAGVLYFSTLAEWAFSKIAPTRCPPAVTAVDGQWVKLVGFMFPLQDTADMKEFCLLRSTQTCCYGPMPQFNQYVLVETPQPVKFERFAPVAVQGVFRVDPRPDENYIYRIEATSVRSVSGANQPPTPQEIAHQANLPLFDFSTLEEIQQRENPQDREREITRQLLPLDGKPIVLHGYVIRRRSSAASRPDDAAYDITLGKYPELKIFQPPTDPAITDLPPLPPMDDSPAAPRRPVRKPALPIIPMVVGLPNASQPDLYNTAPVSLQSRKKVPPLWWQEAAFKGILRITRDPADRPRIGLVRLEDATLAGNPTAAEDLAMDTALLMPLKYELPLLAIACGMIVFVLLRTIKQKPASPNGGRK